MPTHNDRADTVRLVARHSTEILLARYKQWQPLMPQGRFALFVFDLILVTSMAHRPFREKDTGRWLGLEDAAISGRPISATAIARSMQISHTTVRRRATEMVDAGLLEQCATGFRVAPVFFARPEIGEILADDARSLMQILEMMANGGYRPAAAALAAGCAALPPGVVERVHLSFGLRTVENYTQLYGDTTAGTIILGVLAANTRHLIDDPALAQLYAAEDALPPDSVRKPIALRPLAKAIDMPFETVRRRVNALVAEGMMTWKDDGVIVPARVLGEDRFRNSNRQLAGHFEQMLDNLIVLATQNAETAISLGNG